MIRIKVRFFGSAKSLAGGEFALLDLDVPSISSLEAALAARFGGGMETLLKFSKFARGSDLLQGDSILADGDEVVVLPPVSGG